MTKNRGSPPEHIAGGAVQFARKTINSEVFQWKPAVWFKIWFYIICWVNWKEVRVGGKTFERGENFITYAKITEHTRATKHQIDQFMRWAKKERMLTTRKTTRGMIVRVNNYNRYQTLDNYENDTEHETKTIQKRNINDTINKNEKKDKNVKKLKQSTLTSDKSEGRLVNEIITSFKDVNPTFERFYKQIGQRKAVERLLKKFGFKELKAMVGALSEIIIKPYAPKVTSPFELEKNLGKLIAFTKQEQGKGKGKKIIW